MPSFFSVSVKLLRNSLLTLPFFFSGVAVAEDKLSIPRAKRAPVLSEYIGATPTDAGVMVSDYRQFEPGDGEASVLNTKTYLSYDDEHLYAVFVCKDDPKNVRARIARRENLFGDDAVILDLDTFNDKQRSYRFYVNPYGVQLDGKFTEGLGLDMNFDTQWKSDGQLTKDGYVVSIAIPFKSLRFHPGPKQTWGISVGRINPNTNEFSYWPYITKRKEGFVPQFATMEIDAPITLGRNIQIIPYLSKLNSRALNMNNSNQPFWERNNTTQAGVDAKFVLADAFAVDLTVNPDFGEVESDEPQVIIDKRYEALFPEKRPFFLENAGFFTTPQSLFFSRRILDPNLGARITGRTGNWSVGALAINDQAPGKLLPSDNKNANSTAKIMVGRVQTDFANDSNIGVLFTSRRYGDIDNTVGGVDVRWKANENWVFSGQAASSRTNDMNAISSSGRMFFADASRTDRNLKYTGQYLDISQNYDTALAFLPRTNIRQLTQKANYLWTYSDQDWLQNMGPSINAVATKDSQGTLQDWSNDLAYTVTGLRATIFEAHQLNGYELFDGRGFHKNGFLFGASTEWFSWLTASMSMGKNQGINYRPANGVAPLLGDANSYSASLTFTPVPQWRFEQLWFINDLRNQQAQNGQATNSDIYRNLLSRTKISYQHSRFASVRLILDYNQLKANPALTALSSGKRLNTDLQFSYILSPGTTLYVGYTDMQENLNLIGNPQIVQRTKNLDFHTGKRVFAKFSYLFQM